ncbi:Sec-independent protein translocase protein TatC [Kitasatospora indigofera]|uniref:Sec-independent protein translocase protein TatC n=2 Tax=Kitasatospora indigofera TaxID=67307 RepID=A0A919FY23_9ACTN|nr:twin-arginine translocase subunit TatC [Kitasatospora indigofera]GHH74632.1 Sec-independent protein translocase protein TatC [Kitasatospora indigofera]
MSKSSKALKAPKDSEGRMALADHLRELRNRVVKSVLAIVVLTIVALIYHKQIETFLLKPLPQCTVETAAQYKGKCAQVSNIGLTSGFTWMLQVALTAGVVGAVPVWLYQVWAFVVPGLHKHERKYTMIFMACGAPLFIAGAVCAFLLLPTTVEVLISFTPNGTTPILPPNDYFNIATRMVLVFGFAFEFPLLLVMLNLIGMVSGRRLLGWWRGMIMGITVFAAFATPSADPLSMLALAAPIWALYFVAVGVAMLNDRRKSRRNPDAGLDDEEASVLDLSVDAVALPGPVEASAAPLAGAPVPAARREQLDDIT